MTVIIDYGAGNIKSVEKAVNALGYHYPGMMMR